MANYPRCLLCDSKVSSVCGTIYHARGKKPPCAELVVDSQTPTNSASTKLRKIIIELGCRGVIGASERDTAIVDEICKREGIVL